MKQQLEAIKNTAVAAIGECDTPAQIDEIRVKYLGKKGELTALLKQMGQLDPAERPVMGQLVNEAKAQLEALIADRTAIIKKNETALKLKEETIDITMPGNVAKTGK